MTRHRRLLSWVLLPLLALVVLATWSAPATADSGAGKGKRTATPTPTPLRTVTLTPAPTSTPTSTLTPTPSSTPPSIPASTATSTLTSTPTATTEPTGTSTSVATTATATPTATELSTATATSTALATVPSTESPTPVPTLLPTLEPTPVPTLGPLPRTVLTSDGEAYQINAAHTGATQSTTLQPPFAQRWAIDLGGSVSYPIIVQGRVYVTIANPAGYGTKLVALNATSGQVAWGPVDLGGTYWWSALAYDQGSLFALTYDGVLRAFDAVTGVQRWSTQLPGQSSFTSAPTAVQGTVYVGGAGFGGTVYAVNATDASLRWTAPVVNGDESSPVVVGDALFVSYACPNVFRFERLTGTPQWVWTTGCSGGGGKSAVYYDQRLYARDNGAGYVFDSQTGQLVARFQASAAPALADGRGFFRSGTVLTAVDLASMAPLWTYTGDGTLTTAPLVLNQSVIMGSAAGNLTVLEASTGQVLWSANVGTPIPAPDEQNVSQPLTGLSIGDGLLVVPAGTRLVAYAASGTPDTP